MNNRAFEKKAGKFFMEFKARIVEQSQKFKKRKHSENGPQHGTNKKFQGKSTFVTSQDIGQTIVVNVKTKTRSSHKLM